jgi:hypothetical protein
MSMLRWVGVGGLAFFVLELIGFVLFFLAGPPAGLDPPDKLVDYYKAHGTLLTTVILVYEGSFIPLLVLVAALAALIRRAGTAGDWLAAIVFGLGISIVAGAYIDFALIGAAVADGSGSSSPATVRTLAEASAYLANTPFTIQLLSFLAIAGYAIWHTRVLSRWLAWVSWIGALLVALTVPSIYGGNDTIGVYTADGLVGFLSLVPLYVWSVCVAIVALRTPNRTGATVRG